MIKTVQRYILTLLIGAGITFVFHAFFLKNQQIITEEVYLIPSYVINILLAFLILMGINILQKRFFDYLGFVFIAGSLLKFGAYFIFIHPKFKVDQHISAIEASSFLVPYFICLAIEVYFVSKILNNKS